MSLEPDLVFFHHAGVLDGDALRRADAGGGLHEIAPAVLRDALRPEHRRFAERAPDSYDAAGVEAVEYAAAVLSRFLAGRDDYRIVSVDFARDGRYAHVWGLREGWDRRDPLLQELRAAYRSEGYRSYLEANG